MTTRDPSVEYATTLEDQLRGMTEDDRAQVLAELRCLRCGRHPATVEQRVCPSCVVELRGPDRRGA